MATNPSSSDHPVLNASRARQGRYGRHVLFVLLASTALAALALFGAWTWHAPSLAASTSNNGPSRSAAAFDSGPPSAQARQRPADAASPTAQPENPAQGSTTSPP